MAAHTSRITKRFTFILASFTALILFSRAYLVFTTPVRKTFPRHELRVQGRFNTLTAALGLPPLPHTVLLSLDRMSSAPGSRALPSGRVSRIDARALRSEWSSPLDHTQFNSPISPLLPPLHFLPDALSEPPNAPLADLARTFRIVDAREAFIPARTKGKSAKVVKKGKMKITTRSTPSTRA